MTQKIILANPRGYCAGVERAVEVVERALRIFGTPVYVNHEIVHNEVVVKGLEEKGAVFTDKIEEIPEKSVFILSAHGVPPELKERAEKQKLRIIDATCPLVTKVHLEALRYHKKGYILIYIGHRKHQEAIGVQGEAPIHIVETVEDAKRLQIPGSEKIMLLTQTTLSIDDTEKIVHALMQRYPHMQTPPKEDICYATMNRQQAVKDLAKKAPLILVVGSARSSNSRRLVETARYAGVRSYLILDKSELKDAWIKEPVIGITSGASVPEALVKGVIQEIGRRAKQKIEIEPLIGIKEGIRFTLPRGIEQ